MDKIIKTTKVYFLRSVLFSTLSVVFILIVTAPVSPSHSISSLSLNFAAALTNGEIAQYLGAPALCGGGAGTVFTGTAGSRHRCTLSDVSAQCQSNPANPSSCNNEDQGILKLIKTCDSSASFWSWDGKSYWCSAEQQNQSAQAAKLLEQVPNCSLNNFSFYKCLWNPGLAALGSFFLSIGAAILEFAGLSFDTMIQVVVIGFGSTLKTLHLTGTTGGISIAWDAFRDLANILIIGMFTFIAISTILGSKEYGYKRLIARVLVIAVLMNFSLLFTEMVIDASNFTAYQLYAQLAGQGGSTSDSKPSLDVAQAFMQPLGITSIWNTGNPLSITKKTKDSTGSGIQALFTGLVGGILLIVVAVVLFYGTILMASRAVVLVVLMLWSVIAFATYLLPNFAESKYGWKGWWEALINCAVFAPVLMLFLSVSLLIIDGVSPNARGGTNLGGVITDPTQLASGGWQIVVTYLITTGLLFVSLKIASHFANTTSGISFSAAAMVAPLALGTRFAGEAWGRRRGRKAEEAAINKRSEAAQIRSSLKPGSDKKLYRKAAKLDRDASKLSKRAQSSFNPMDAKLSKLMMKAGFGSSGFMAGQTPPKEHQELVKAIRQAAAAANAEKSAATPAPAQTNTAAAAGPANAAAQATPAPAQTATAPAQTPAPSTKTNTQTVIEKRIVESGADNAHEESRRQGEMQESKSRIADAAATAQANAVDSGSTEQINRIRDLFKNKMRDQIEVHTNESNPRPDTAPAQHVPLQVDISTNVITHDSTPAINTVTKTETSVPVPNYSGRNIAPTDSAISSPVASKTEISTPPNDGPKA